MVQCNKNIVFYIYEKYWHYTIFLGVMNSTEAFGRHVNFALVVFLRVKSVLPFMLSLLAAASNLRHYSHWQS